MEIEFLGNIPSGLRKMHCQVVVSLLQIDCTLFGYSTMAIRPVLTFFLEKINVFFWKRTHGELQLPVISCESEAVTRFLEVYPKNGSGKFEKVFCKWKWFSANFSWFSWVLSGEKCNYVQKMWFSSLAATSTLLGNETGTIRESLVFIARWRVQKKSTWRP